MEYFRGVPTLIQDTQGSHTLLVNQKTKKLLQRNTF